MYYAIYICVFIHFLGRRCYLIIVKLICICYLGFTTKNAVGIINKPYINNIQNGQKIKIHNVVD